MEKEAFIHNLVLIASDRRHGLLCMAAQLHSKPAVKLNSGQGFGQCKSRKTSSQRFFWFNLMFILQVCLWLLINDGFDAALWFAVLEEDSFWFSLYTASDISQHCYIFVQVTSVVRQREIHACTVPAFTFPMFPMGIPDNVFTHTSCSWIPDANGRTWVRMQEIIRIPAIEFLAALFFYAILWVLMRLEGKLKSKGQLNSRKAGESAIGDAKRTRSRATVSIPKQIGLGLAIIVFYSIFVAVRCVVLESR